MPDLTKFVDGLAASLAATLAQLMSCEVTHSEEPEQQLSAPEVWCTAQLQGGPGCEIAIATNRQTALLLARAMLSETPAEGAEFGVEDEELLAEFWKQAFGRATTDLMSLLHDAVLDYASAKAPEWAAAVSSKVALRSEKAAVELSVKLSDGIVQRLALAQETPTFGTVEPMAEANNLDLLLDVPLAVTLRFGQRPMPLRDVLQLTSGSVVELDRQAEDAVDLLLDDRLIARGQVVVVDGCYGLRVTEVVR